MACLQVILVTELAAGGSLLDRLVQQTQDHHTSVPLAHARAILRQVLQAVAYMHMCGVVHGNIKPGNVRIDLPHSQRARRPAWMAPENSSAQLCWFHTDACVYLIAR